MLRGARERLAAVGPGLLALACGLLASRGSPAQPPALPPAPAAGASAAGSARQDDGVLFHKSPSFRIPFKIEPQDQGRIREVQLYYSVDSGQTWHNAGAVAPDRGSFTFRAPRDAEYWFAVRTLDDRGRVYPPDDAPFERPNMRVVVDTTPPTLVLSATGRRGSRAGVQWEARDEHLDPNSLVIQYQAEGARDWRDVPIQKFGLLGREEWDAGTAAPLLVHAWIDDRAGNRTLVDLRLGDGIAAAPPPAAVADEPYRDFEPPPPIAPIRSASLPDNGAGFAEPSGSFNGFAPGPAGRNADFFTSGTQASGLPPADPYAPPPPDPGSVPSLLVGSRNFALNYAVEDAGPTGPALVELWVTRDGGQTWNREPADADRVSPYEVDLGGEGTYGLWLVVQSASGLGDLPPRPGDRPQLWVEVDTTPPAVRLDPPRIGTGPNLGKVLITWQASDPHLAEKPVLISYRADEAGAPWTPIGGRMDNLGSYIWTVPPEVPPRFHLRIDVIDSVGNKAWVETTPRGPILVDRSRPRGRILGLDPGGGRAASNDAQFR